MKPLPPDVDAWTERAAIRAANVPAHLLGAARLDQIEREAGDVHLLRPVEEARRIEMEALKR